MKREFPTILGQMHWKQYNSSYIQNQAQELI